MMKKMLLISVVALVATATANAVTIPVANPDGTLVTGPGIGRSVIPFSGQTWMVCGNDNFGDVIPGGDNDFNEPCLKATFKADGTFLAELLFNVTAYDNSLGVQGQAGWVDPANPSATFNYVAGVEVVFDQWVKTLGVHLLSGDGSRNSDGIPYVWTSILGTPEQQSETPEPNSLLVMGATLAVLFLLLWRRL